MAPIVASISPSQLQRIRSLGARTKATNVISTLAAIRRTVPPSALESIIAAAPVGTRALVERALLPIEWVPLADWIPVVEGVFDLLGRDQSAVRDTAEHWASLDFKGVYGFIVRMASPDFVIRQAPSVWGFYYDQGQVQALEHRQEGKLSRVRVGLADFVPWPVFPVLLAAFASRLLVSSGALGLELMIQDTVIDERLSTTLAMSYASR